MCSFLESLYIILFVEILDVGHVLSTIDFAGLVATDSLLLVSTAESSGSKYFHLLHLSDATLRPVMWFSESESSINYDQMIGIEITPDAIFISIDNQLHVYGNYRAIYSASF